MRIVLWTFNSLKQNGAKNGFGLLAAFFLVACGGSGPHMLVDGNSPGGSGPNGVQEPTFSFFEDIQPILANRCSLCHPGATPDDWEDYDHSRARADLLALRVGNNTMPPGNATQMTDEEREMVLVWVDEGAPE